VSSAARSTPTPASEAGGSAALAVNPTYAFVSTFFGSLRASGVRNVCISPGSRSAPLAVAASWDPELRTWVHVDERSAAFFGLGLARASDQPVALVCTSGTAAANYLPAVIEASHVGAPLIVLTADRPPELRGWDAGQTIDQLKLYGGAVRFFAELPVPGSDPGALRYARRLAARAVAESLGQGGAPGPVHLNWPLREPLHPGAFGPREACAARAPVVEGVEGVVDRRAPALPPVETVAALAALVRPGTRGAIACGPMSPSTELAAAVVRLASRAGWPVLADPASNLRAGSHVREGAPVIVRSDFLLRDDRFAAEHAPDLVLRLGSTPVSKALRLWLERHPPRELISVDPFGAASDPSHLATRTLAVDATTLCDAWADAIEAPGDGSWLASWLDADARAVAAVDSRLAADNRLLEPRAVRELCDALPDDTLLYVSNSMPVRHLDACMPASHRRVRVLANRGANGIDGMVSSAFGAAAAGRGQRTVLLTGDLALLHDLGGLHASRFGLDLTIVVLDNDGGGIFSFLPIAADGDSVDFEALFRTPHGLDFENAARLFGARYWRAESVAQLRAALAESFEAAGLSMVHVPTDRDASVAQFQALAAVVSESASGESR
jgi:2-succinyl-5-enolpyruvyl-6-hydroxy-3-cyclohexene-1-carboxylate synthase